MSSAEEREQGAYVAVVTPFTDGGLVAFGSTGDGPWLSLDEKFACLDSLGEIGLLDSTIVTVTEQHPGARRALAGHLEALPVAGVLVLPPYYYGKHRPLDLKRHFATLADACGRPVLAHHIPKHAPPVPLEAVEDDDGAVDVLSALRDVTHGSERPWLLKKLASQQHGIDLGPVRPPAADDTAADVGEAIRSAGPYTTSTGGIGA